MLDPDGAQAAADNTRSSTSLDTGSSVNARTARRLLTASYTSMIPSLYVHDRLPTVCHGLFEALAGDAVDAGIGRGGDDLVAVLAQNGDGLRTDQAGAADNDDLHCASPPPARRGQGAD